MGTEVAAQQESVRAFICHDVIWLKVIENDEIVNNYETKLESEIIALQQPVSSDFAATHLKHLATLSVWVTMPVAIAKATIRIKGEE